MEKSIAIHHLVSIRKVCSMNEMLLSGTTIVSDLDSTLQLDFEKFCKNQLTCRVIDAEYT